MAAVLIAHAPTNREVKSTAAFLEAVDRLRAEGHDIEVDLIEGRTWDECLERKARADIYFDQVKLGYGNNSVECWGMGIPVIAGAAPVTLAARIAGLLSPLLQGLHAARRLVMSKNGPFPRWGFGEMMWSTSLAVPRQRDPLIRHSHRSRLSTWSRTRFQWRVL